ncbi:MAG: hypothetical protein AB1420_07845 [Bacillota bacterium]
MDFSSTIYLLKEKIERRIKAQGDAEAARIYNEAYNRDVEFYKFYKALTTIEETIKDNTTLFLPHDSDLAKILLNK